MNSMVEILAGYAHTQPDKLFAVDESRREYTYASAYGRVKNAAAALIKKWGVARGDRILVLCNQKADYLIIDMACNLAGAIFVPLEGDASADRIREIADETQAVLFVTSSERGFLDKSTTYNELLSYSEEVPEFVFGDEEDIAEILYTTGTTGKSKGIMISNRANIALAENVKFGVCMNENNIELIPLVMSHSHGLRTFYANLLNGGAVVIANGVMNVKNIFRLMEAYHVTSLDLSPSAAQILIKLSKGAFWDKAKSLDYIEIGTAVLPEELKDELVDNLPGVHLYNFYGSTESGRTCALDFSVSKNKKKCIGKPSKNAEIVFTNDGRIPINATPENPGLLASRGSMNMSGYWRNEELTREILVDGFVFTNDLGFFDDDGYAFIIGRRDDVINYNGIKISPTEIEDIVTQYPEIEECACVGISDSMAGQIPKLFVVAKDSNTFRMDEFIQSISNRIDKTKMPKQIELIDSLPRTFNGKLNRKELAERGMQ